MFSWLDIFVAFSVGFLVGLGIIPSADRRRWGYVLIGAGLVAIQVAVFMARHWGAWPAF